jgi:elongator complex protein 3
METNPDSCYEEFKTRTAFVRELHVYGTIQKVGDHNKNSVQHYGFGKKLLQKAEQLALQNNCNKMAIISGVGVRKYYEKHGYQKTTDGKYMVKELVDLWSWWWIGLVICYTASKVFM